MITDIKNAYKYAVDQWKDINPYYSVYEGWRTLENPDYTNRERALVLLMYWSTDFAAAVTVAFLMHTAVRDAPIEEDCEKIADVWSCRKGEMPAATKIVCEIIFTLILANIFSTVLGGSILKKGFNIDCCIQPILYVWLVIILAFALVLVFAFVNFSEECKLGCYTCAPSCDPCHPPTDEYFDDYCGATYVSGGAQSAIAWGYTQVNSLLFVIPTQTVVTYFRMKVDYIPFIGIKTLEYEAPEPTWLKKCCES